MKIEDKYFESLTVDAITLENEYCE